MVLLFGCGLDGGRSECQLAVSCKKEKKNQVHLIILKKIYPFNLPISKYSEIDEPCSFCGLLKETAVYLLLIVKYSN